MEAACLTPRCPRGLPRARARAGRDPIDARHGLPGKNYLRRRAFLQTARAPAARAAGRRRRYSPCSLSLVSGCPSKGTAMNRLHGCIAITGLVIAAWCGAAFAQQSRSDTSQKPTPSNLAKSNQGGKNDADTLTHGDRRFIEQAAKDNAAEVESGKLAQTKGSS